MTHPFGTLSFRHLLIAADAELPLVVEVLLYLVIILLDATEELLKLDLAMFSRYASKSADSLNAHIENVSLLETEDDSGNTGGMHKAMIFRI